MNPALWGGGGEGGRERGLEGGREGEDDRMDVATYVQYMHV